MERHRLGAPAEPEVVVELSTGSPAIFRDRRWNQSIDALVFDDRFVDENVYSGLTVEAGHRQNLHEVVLGAEAVQLALQLRGLVDDVEAHNRTLREVASTFPPEWLHGLPVDSFCNLPEYEDVDERIADAERNLAVAKDRERVRSTPNLTSLELPSIDADAIAELLARDLPTLQATALARIRDHFAVLGAGSEEWISDGSRRAHVAGLNSCPYCGQTIGPDTIAADYDAYFGTEYRALVDEIDDAISAVNRQHSGDVQAAFERQIRLLGERADFWRTFATVPDIEVDTATLVGSWRAAREAALGALAAKRAAPLEAVDLDGNTREQLRTYEQGRTALAVENLRIADANIEIGVAKERAEADTVDVVGGDLQRLRAARTRRTEAAVAACDQLVQAKRAKAVTEERRDSIRGQLDTLRATAFPRYEDSCNRYLERLNAEFRLSGVTSVNTRGGPAVSYNLLVNGRPIAVTGGDPTPGTPSFGSALSAGDRTTLAFALFLASVDVDPGLGAKVIVIDDPISSLDDQRTQATVREVRNLGPRCAQLIVLSHHRAFLCATWEAMERVPRAAMQLPRVATGSTLRAWDVDADSTTEHDRRDLLLRGYLEGRAADLREVAKEVRPHLEAYLRVVRPAEFPPGTLIGPFLQRCRDRLTAGDPIISQERIDELQDLLDFANRFHHDGNPAWATEPITDGELQGIVRRALAFAR